MSIIRRLAEIFTPRKVPETVTPANGLHTGRSSSSSSTGEGPRAEPALQQTLSEQANADAPFPAPRPGQPRPGVTPPAPGPDPSPALGASALLDAWKARESALNKPSGLPEPEGLTFPQSPFSPGQPGQGAPDPRPVALGPGRLSALAPWGIVLAAAIGLGGWLMFNTDRAGLPGGGKPDAARSGPAEPAGAQLVMCPFEPVVPVTGDNDGKFPMQPDVAGLAAVDIASFVVLSNEASAAGRGRDAEVALLMSCRIADKLKGAASVESADAKYRLGQHYADLSLRGNAPAAPRAEWLARAQILLADSLLTYSTRFGDTDDRSRLAASALASVRQAVAQKAQAQPAPLAVPASPGANGLSGAARSPAPSGPVLAARPPATPLPALQAPPKTRPTPPVLKECPPAVATLGLCD